jgi:hypothetical protein
VADGNTSNGFAAERRRDVGSWLVAERLAKGMSAEGPIWWFRYHSTGYENASESTTRQRGLEALGEKAPIAA